MKRELSLLLCAALETGLNQLISQSPEDYAKLRDLQRQVIGIQLAQLSWPLYFIFSDNVLVLSHYEGKVATQVNVDLTTLYQLREGANLTELIKQDKLSLEGDLSLLQTFSQLIQTLDIDFAEPLSRYLGDAPTHMLFSHLKRTRDKVTEIFHQTQSHVAQLTTEEYRIAPHKLEYIQFSDNVDTLNLDLEQLSLRISHLSHKVTTTA
ncbi:ubiquinone biosynthesis accessory factor UbiJ [Shewanella surugensis]|uniref:Ubiquinone biosynthesis accessory factor UbiJ n=1 Tax=Shewanella surugensis TaxID=212020 RepID=A0ABT0LF21_9GAMM|nr:SCP2 sterol-binding domain-containing protein [Shewanella surugensis]MCL1126307.1 SCP2 sterol-binding domain-containing protein [Shewanella surugensis]